MEKLIKINYESVYPVSARELHEALEIKTAFKDWFPRMAEYGFEQGKDFNPLKIEQVQIEGGRRVQRDITDYHITIDMAKELCMIQRTEKGKQCRKYFLDVEKAWNTPEQIMARALKMADRTIAKLTQSNSELTAKVETDKPKVLFADSVTASDDTILIRALAKLICQNGYEIGEKRLYEWLRNNGYLIKANCADRNLPTQKSMDLKLFVVKETTRIDPDGFTKVDKVTKVTGKGQQYFINKFAQFRQQKLSL